MQVKTKAIVLKYIKYTDTSIIAYLFTKELGRQTYIIRGVRGKKSKIKINLFQALSVLDIDAVQKQKRNIQSLKEAKPSFVLNDIYTDIYKSSIAFFIAEIIFKTIKDEEYDEDLYNFIEDFIFELERAKEFSNFHLIFLIRLTSYLGFLPNTDEIKYGLDNEFPFDYVKIFDSILSTPTYNVFLPLITKQNRSELLRVILNYYALHLPNFTEIKSLKILKEVFS